MKKTVLVVVAAIVAATALANAAGASRADSGRDEVRLAVASGTPIEISR